MITWLQYRERMIQSIMAEYECSKADAEGCVETWYATWQQEVKDALKAEQIPTQAWVNTVQSRDRDGNRIYGWWESFLKHNPDVFDRLFKAGLSTHMPKRELWAPQKV
jgi:hypothetical protein